MQWFNFNRFNKNQYILTLHRIQYRRVKWNFIELFIEKSNSTVENIDKSIIKLFSFRKQVHVLGLC